MPVILFFKSYVRAHSRKLPSGRIVQVGSYHNSVTAKPKVEAGRDDRTEDLFGGQQERREAKQDEEPRKFYVTMVRDGKQVAWIAGPFDTHEEALAQVDAAREAAYKVDPRSHFDAFGTASIKGDKHPPGKLNDMLGIYRDDAMKDSGDSRRHGILSDYIKRGDLKGALDWLNTAPRKEIEEAALYAGLSVTWFNNHKDRMAWFSSQIAEAIKRNKNEGSAATA